MKVKIGISPGAAGAPGEFEAMVGLLEAAGVDSLWLPETVYGPSVEPFTGMAFALPTAPLRRRCVGADFRQCWDFSRCGRSKPQR
jgi:hypothetical protein